MSYGSHGAESRNPYYRCQWITLLILPYPGIFPVIFVVRRGDADDGALVAVLLDLEGVKVALKGRGVVVLVVDRHDHGSGGAEPRRTEVCGSYLFGV